MSRARIAALLSAVAVALSAGAAPALAQSPGDSQYRDPLAGQSGGSGSSGGSSGGSEGSSGGSSGSSSGSPGRSSGSGAGSSGDGATAAAGGSGADTDTGSGEGLSDTPPAAQAPAATSEGRTRLPDTGAETWILLVLAGGLLLTGGVLRVRTAR